MKEIRTVKMVEQIDIKFIADDGKEFIGENAERDCRAYERQKDEKKVKEAFERLEVEKIDMPFVSWFNDDSKFWKVTFESKKDYYAMYDYLKIDGYYDVNIEMPTEFPCTEIIALGYDYAYDYGRNLKEDLQKALEQLEQMEN